MMLLFDVNVLLALHDRDHQSHEVVHQFVGGQARLRWATCGITEAGFIRVASSPAYPGMDLTPKDAADVLTATTESLGEHSFWDKIPSLLAPSLFSLEALQGHRQVTDTLLLGICHANKGQLLTLDSKIQTAAIKRADRKLVTCL